MMTASMFSGLLISKSILSTLGIQLNVGQEWKRIHTLTSDAALILLAVHFALHFKWIIFNLKRYLAAPVINVFQRSHRDAPVVQPVRIDHNH
jgi:hypothetical protein